MSDELYEAIADLIESLFIFPVNQPTPVWVWTDDSEQTDLHPHQRPLLWKDADRVQRLRELYETERIRRDDERQSQANLGKPEAGS